MNINTFTKEIYERLLTVEPEKNQRTGINVYALPGITFQTDLETEGFPLLSLRKMSFSFIPEIMWFLSGQRNAKWLSKHTKIWDSFIDEDGSISSAYGYRWRNHFGFDQLQTIIEKLERDKSSRHGVLMMWSPKDDLLVKQKNVPCPFSVVLNIINNRLHLHLIIRSNDMCLGFPTDVAGFAFFQKIIAQRLNIRVGTLTVSISNCHIYENQLPAIKEMITRTVITEPVQLILPGGAYGFACGLNDFFIDQVKANIHNYTPHEAIKNIPIAL